MSFGLSKEDDVTLRRSEVSDRWSGLVQSGFLSNDSYERYRRHKKSLSYLPDSSDICILEVGAGAGNFNKLLLDAGYSKVIGSDITWEHVALAREKSPAGKFVVASGEKLPFVSELFDAVISNAAIEHFMNPLVGILEMARVLRPGGIAVITSDCYIWRVFQLLGLYRSRMPIDRAMTFGKFKSMFMYAGLVIDDFEAWGVTHYLRPFKNNSVFRKLRSTVEADRHWVNRKSRSGAINRLRTLILDENLFFLHKPGERRRTAWDGFSDVFPKHLVCTDCGAASLDFNKDKDGLICSICNRVFPVRDGIPIFTGVQPFSSVGTAFHDHSN